MEDIFGGYASHLNDLKISLFSHEIFGKDGLLHEEMCEDGD